MKKILISVMVILCLSICGCENTGKDVTDHKIINENLLRCEITYRVNEDKANPVFFNLAIDFQNIDLLMDISMSNGKKISYVINDESRVSGFFKEIVRTSSNNRSNSNNSNGEQMLLWNIKIESDADKYIYLGSNEVPDYWDELFEVLIETTEAETLEDFGFGDTDKYETYTITEKTLNESNEAFIKEIKYPYLENKKDYFKDINEQIEDVINEFDVFRMSDDSEIQWSYWNTYEIVEQTYDNIIVKFNITAYPVGNPELKKEEYLLNIDLITETVTIEK